MICPPELIVKSDTLPSLNFLPIVVMHFTYSSYCTCIENRSYENVSIGDTVCTVLDYQILPRKIIFPFFIPKLNRTLCQLFILMTYERSKTAIFFHSLILFTSLIILVV